MDWDQIAFEHLCRTRPEVAIEIDVDGFLRWIGKQEQAVTEDIVREVLMQMEGRYEQRPAN